MTRLGRRISLGRGEICVWGWEGEERERCFGVLEGWKFHRWWWDSFFSSLMRDFGDGVIRGYINWIGGCVLNFLLLSITVIILLLDYFLSFHILFLFLLSSSKLIWYDMIEMLKSSCTCVVDCGYIVCVCGNATFFVNVGIFFPPMCVVDIYCIVCVCVWVRGNARLTTSKQANPFSGCCGWSSTGSSSLLSLSLVQEKRKKHIVSVLHCNLGTYGSLCHEHLSHVQGDGSSSTSINRSNHRW
jgi:hypothetical protein